MKLTILLITINLASCFASVYSQKVSLNLKEAKFSEVINEISKQTNLDFAYSKNFVDTERSVSIIVTNADLKTVLDKLLDGTQLLHIEVNGKIYLGPKILDSIIEASILQQQKISGNVTDLTTGEAIIGANVVIEGSTIGVITDANGNFNLDISNSTQVLVITYLGYNTERVTMNGQSKLEIKLVPDITKLDEVVVIGYGTVKKSDLTGSLSSVKAKEINAFPTTNVMQSLSGRAPGVQVLQNSGAPGGGVSVRIRGTNSIQGSNEPLYVIDGFPYSASNPTVLSNNDIESIEILKDASATAIYGSRGANGVVLITTKRGKAGKTTVDFESSFGLQTLRKKLDLMDATEYATFYNEQASNDKVAPYFTQEQVSGFGKGYDWQDLTFSQAPVLNNSLTINGGNEKTQFSLSGSLFDQQGIIKNSSYKRYSVRANINHDINKMFSINYGATLTKNSALWQNSGGGNRGSDLISGTISAPPTITPFNDDGTYRNLSTAYPFISNVLVNPLNFINETRDRTVSNYVLANVSFVFKPMEGMTLKIYGGIDNSDSRSSYYQTLNYVNSQGNASANASNNISLLNENTLSYTKTLNRHSFTALAGFTYQDFTYNGLGGSGIGFLSDVTETANLGSASTPGIPSSGYSKSVLMSYLSRINYSFSNKYLLTLSIRADGSSKYSEGNKWGYFPSGALAWKVKEEQFMKDMTLISDLKVRTSWGYTGSQAIGPYATLNQLSSGKTVFGDALYTTWAPSTVLPGDLKWETTEQFDVGFDIAILENRFRLAADAYLKNTRDLLNTVMLPSSLGFTSTIRNVGQIQNKGLEFSIDAKLLTGEFKWDVNANIAFNRNKVVKLYNGQDILTGYIYAAILTDNTSLLREGKPMSVFYGYKTDGYDANGKEIYKDLSGSTGEPDGVINQYDKTIIGNPNPDYIYGFNSTLSFKGFELNLFVQGSQGNDIANCGAINSTLDYGFGLNMTKDVYNNHWTPTNTNAKYPVLSRNASMRYSNRQIEDGSYLRLKNIQLAYNLPLDKMGITWMRNVQIYASGQNLFTKTKYSWWDPEVNSQGGANSTAQGIDNYSYPTSKTIMFGIKVGF